MVAFTASLYVGGNLKAHFTPAGSVSLGTAFLGLAFLGLVVCLHVKIFTCPVKCLKILYWQNFVQIFVAARVLFQMTPVALL